MRASKSNTADAISFLRSGDYKAALEIFSTFRNGFTKAEMRTIEIAKECLTGNETFYRSIGIDTVSEIKKSKRILELKYLKR